MGRVLDGKWVTHDLGPDAQGRYVRREAQFRAVVEADPGAEFPAAAGRYHLYFAYPCGWCHRVLIARQLKGLTEVITASATEAYMGESGWTLLSGTGPVEGVRHAWEVYVAAQPDYTGRASVPILWDRQAGRIVTNESTDLVRCFDTAFDGVGGDASVRLFPADRAAAIDAMIADNYGPVNNGVYRCGFARSQAAYDDAAQALFARLDALEQILSRQRYLCSDDQPTAADWCVFPTLFRFDTVYYTHFKCNLRHVYEYPNLWGYVRELYQWPGIRETCDLAEAKTHYFTSHESIHPRRYVPIGPDLDFEAPHGRG